METLYDKVGKYSKGWYLAKIYEKNFYFKIINFGSQEGGINSEECFFTAEFYDEKGNLKNPRYLLGITNTTSNLLKSISEEDLPWNKQDNKPNLSEQGDFNSYYPGLRKLAKLVREINQNSKQDKHIR